MSESMYRNQLDRLLKDKVALEDKRASAVRFAARYRDEAQRTRSSITKSTSASSARMKEHQALADSSAPKGRIPTPWSSSNPPRAGVDRIPAEASVSRRGLVRDGDRVRSNRSVVPPVA